MFSVQYPVGHIEQDAAQGPVFSYASSSSIHSSKWVNQSKFWLLPIAGGTTVKQCTVVWGKEQDYICMLAVGCGDM